MDCKYLQDDGHEGVMIIPEKSEEAMKVSLQLAMGVDYGKFDIDPIEAGILMYHIKQFALETKNVGLLKSVELAILRHRPCLKAFCIVVDKEIV